jgi:hypothetical protein
MLSLSLSRFLPRKAMAQLIGRPVIESGEDITMS